MDATKSNPPEELSTTVFQKFGVKWYNRLQLSIASPDSSLEEEHKIPTQGRIILCHDFMNDHGENQSVFASCTFDETKAIITVCLFLPF